MDGITAAWVANQFLDNAELRPMGYSQQPPTDLDVQDRDVYVVDFSFKREDCERIASLASSIKILDHHKSAQKELKGLPYAEFDMDRSGAGMTWDFFSDSSRPWLVNYVEDRDLWRFKLPHSKEINAGIATTERTIDAWEKLFHMGRDATYELGKGALAFEAMCARNAANTVRSVEFEGSEIPFVNTQYELASVTAGLLAETAPFAVAWFQLPDGRFQYSLRSRGEDGVDVSEIAVKRGGGGHKNAAGFITDLLLTSE